MFLSLMVSSLEPDGSLVVDLTGEHGPVLKFGPLGSGMPWSRLEGGSWVPTDHDYGVLLVNESHERCSDLPIHRYLASLAAGEFATLNRLRRGQATVLQLMARWPEAEDLLEANPVLLWMVADRYAAQPKERHRVSELLLKPQTDILGWVLGEPVRPAQVRLLTRLALTGSDEHTFALLRQVSANASLVERLKHWPKIPSGLLGLFLESPVVTELDWLRREASEMNDEFDGMRVVRQHLRLLRDTTRMIGFLNAADPGEPIDLRSCRSAKGAHALHQRLIEAAQRLGWIKMLAADVAPTAKFPAPPIPSTASFEAITGVAELVREGVKMKHCVVTRAQDVMSGRSALYRMNFAGQRATLEVAVGRNGEPLEIEEFRGPCNVQPSDAAIAEARKFVKAGREAWALRNAVR